MTLLNEPLLAVRQQFYDQFDGVRSALSKYYFETDCWSSIVPMDYDSILLVLEALPPDMLNKEIKFSKVERLPDSNTRSTDDWLLAPMLARGTVVSVSGNAGVGKTKTLKAWIDAELTGQGTGWRVVSTDDLFFQPPNGPLLAPAYFNLVGCIPDVLVIEDVSKHGNYRLDVQKAYIEHMAYLARKHEICIVLEGRNTAMFDGTDIHIEVTKRGMEIVRSNIDLQPALKNQSIN